MEHVKSKEFCGSALCLFVDDEVVKAAALYEGLKLIDVYPPTHHLDEYIGVLSLIASVSLKPLDEYIIFKRNNLWYIIISLIRSKVLVLALSKYVSPSIAMNYAESVIKSLREFISKRETLII